MLNVYPAGEEPLEGVTSENFLKELKHSQASLFLKEGDAVSQVTSNFEEGDVVLTLGAGDVYKLNVELAERYLKLGKL